MAKKPSWFATAQVISIHDGDTFKARIDLLEDRRILPAQRVDLGFRMYLETPGGHDSIATASAAGVHLFTEMNVRLFGYGAPELDEEAGRASLAFLLRLIPPGTTVRLESKRLDKYGRCEAVVTLNDGRDLGELLLHTGMVRQADSRGYLLPPK